MSISARTVILLLLLVAAGLVAALLAYRVVDLAAELTDARQEQRYREQQRKLLLDLVRQTASSMSRERIRSLGQQYAKQGQIVKEFDDRLEIDSVVFKFSGDRLVDVSELGQGK